MRTSATHLLLALVLPLALWGCGRREPQPASGTTGQSTAPGLAPSPSANSALAAALPQEIDQLTDQVIIYECPKCNRMYDANGECPKDGAQLYATKVTFICAYDDEIIDHYGRCPKCGRMVKIEKAKMLPGGIRVERVN